MNIEKILNIIFLTALPFIFIGVINKVRAFWAGRQGPPLFQLYYDFLKLLKKGRVIGAGTSFIFDISPSVTFASVFFAGMLVPMANHISVISFEGDFILFIYILAAGKYFSVIAAMDTGSSFEGMGASREVTFTSFTDPALIIIIASLVFISGSYSFENIFNLLDASHGLNNFVILLSAITIFIVILVEGCRVPVDDPNTHLELTMIHEVMILDNSGPDLALILYGSAMKLVIFGALIANLIIPSDLNIYFYTLSFFGILFLLAVFIGCIESLIARLRMSHVPQFIFFAITISLFMSLIVVAFRGGNY